MAFETIKKFAASAYNITKSLASFVALTFVNGCAEITGGQLYDDEWRKYGQPNRAELPYRVWASVGGSLLLIPAFLSFSPLLIAGAVVGALTIHTLLALKGIYENDMEKAKQDRFHKKMDTSDFVMQSLLFGIMSFVPNALLALGSAFIGTIAGGALSIVALRTAGLVGTTTLSSPIINTGLLVAENIAAHALLDKLKVTPAVSVATCYVTVATFYSVGYAAKTVSSLFSSNKTAAGPANGPIERSSSYEQDVQNRRYTTSTGPVPGSF